MRFFSVFWQVLVLLAVAGFSFLTIVIIVKGAGELREIFRRLGRPRDETPRIREE